MDPFKSATHPVDGSLVYPSAILIKHVAAKGLQVGSLLGLLASPMYAVVRGKPIVATTLSGLLWAPPAGFLLSMGMLAYKAVDMDEDGANDRGFRIHVHPGQNRVDTLCLVGSLVGASVGAIFGTRGFHSILPAAAAACALGVIAHGATMQAEQWTGMSVSEMARKMR